MLKPMGIHRVSIETYNEAKITVGSQNYQLYITKKNKKTCGTRNERVKEYVKNLIYCLISIQD